jgi:hypothetical protein
MHVREERGHFIGADSDVRALRNTARCHVGNRIVPDPELCFPSSRKDGVKHRPELVKGRWRSAGIFQIGEHGFNAFGRNSEKRETPDRLRQDMTSKPQSLRFYTRCWATMVKPPFAYLTKGQRGIARERVDSEALALGLAFQLAEETLGLRLCLGLRDSEAPAARSVSPAQDVAAIAEENTHGDQSPSHRP